MRRIANCLRNLASQFSAALNFPSKKARKRKKLLSVTSRDLEVYKPFLLDVLKATADSHGNEQVVYPLLEANTDKLNDIFAEVLWRWAINIQARVELNTTAYFARVIGNFSILVSAFPLGNKASNMEIAITGYEAALTILTRSAFPQDWAMTQMHLGNTYCQRVLGEQAENIEQGIAAFSAALQVFNRSAFPQDWAGTQYALGNAYRNRKDRTRGDKAKNLKLAIAAYTAALEVINHSSFPQNWAATQYNLGSAYFERIRGDKTENIDLDVNLGVGGSKSPTPPNQPSPSFKELLDNAIKKNSPLLGNAKTNQKL